MDNTIRSMQIKVEKMYHDVLTPLGAKYQLEVLAPRTHAAGKPTILFLGNHSSGKSTFINHLLGTSVQKTGIAPTDDGFTVLTYSETPEQSTGPAAALRPEIIFSALDRFGPAFLSRLKLKMLNLELLKSMNLVDSPGMIDAASTGQERGYDFMAAVRSFGESADLIVFFLDPEKPGTTGETIAAFTKALSGLENKVLILMNKADMFENIRDFARDYGALCWNLSRVIKTKDLPEIFTTYIPNLRSNRGDESSGVPLEGFDEAREEVIQQIRNAKSRRVDNVISTMTEQARRLDMHIHVCWDLKRRLLSAQAICSVITFVLFATTVAFGYIFREANPRTIPLAVVGGGLGATVMWWIVSQLAIRQYGKSLIEDLDATFERIYLRDFTLGQRDDLTTRWEAIRDHAESALKSMGLRSLPSRSPRSSRQFRKLQKLLNRNITNLRR